MALKLTDRLDRVAWRRNMVFGRIARVQDEINNLLKYEKDFLIADERSSMYEALEELNEVTQLKSDRWRRLKNIRKIKLGNE